jgi:uncharacterized protein Yka (UPF0111/DUF47 family)
VANVKRNFSMPERSAELIEKYAKEVGLSQSAFVSLMVNQIDQVMTSLQKMSGEEKEGDAGASGSD